MRKLLFTLILIAFGFFLITTICVEIPDSTWKVQYTDTLEITISNDLYDADGHYIQSSGNRIRVLAKVTDGKKSGFVVESDDRNHRGIVYRMDDEVWQQAREMPDRFINTQHVHYVSENVFGDNIQNVISRWGEYVTLYEYKRTIAGRERTEFIYAFPQINKSDDAGIKVVTDSAGIVTGFYKYDMDRSHKNLFHIFPLCDKILSINLEERMMKSVMSVINLFVDEQSLKKHIADGIMVVSPKVVVEEPGYIESIIQVLIWMALLFGVLYVLRDILVQAILSVYPKVDKNIMTAAKAALLIIIIPIPAITLFQYYHIIWWLSALLVAEIIIVILAMGKGSRQCTKCKTYKWDVKCVKDANGTIYTKYPKLTSFRNSKGEVDVKVTHEETVTTPMLQIYTCQNCGNVEKEEYEETVTRMRTKCPQCGNSIGRGDWDLDWEIVGGQIECTYREECSQCGYVYIPKTKTIEIPPIPAPPKRTPQSVGDSNTGASSKCRPNDCQFCKHRIGKRCDVRSDVDFGEGTIGPLENTNTAIACPMAEYKE